MTEKQALLIAYNILNDELERCEDEYGIEADDYYYIEIQQAINKIDQMRKGAPKMRRRKCRTIQ